MGRRLLIEHQLASPSGMIYRVQMTTPKGVSRSKTNTITLSTTITIVKVG